MNKLKKYLENHPDATIQDYNNQKHKMHVMQAGRELRGNHNGTLTKKQLLSIINRG